MWKGATLVLAALTLALGGVALYLSDQLSSARDLASQEASDRAKAEATVQSLQRRNEELEASYFTLQRHAPRPDETAPPKVATAEVTPASRAPGFFGPPGRAPGFDGGRMGPMGPRQAASWEMIRHLKLSDAQSSKLMQVLTEDQDKFRRALESASDSGQPPDAQLLDSLRSEADQHVRDVLGDAKYQEYEDYRKYSMEHEQIDRLNSRLASVNQPLLSADQQDQLFNVMKEERNRVPAPVASQFGSRTDFQMAYEQWRQDTATRTQTRASTFLNTDQVNILKNIRTPPFYRPPSTQPTVRPPS